MSYLSLLKIFRRPVPRSFLFVRSACPRLTMGKRKRQSGLATVGDVETPAPPPSNAIVESKTSRRNSQRKSISSTLNPEENDFVEDAASALRASPDAEINTAIIPNGSANGTSSKSSRSQSKKSKANTMTASESVSNVSEMTTALLARKAALKGDDTPGKTKTEGIADPEVGEEDDVDADPEEIKQALTRPPPVNSDYLPLPWKGRLGYACLNTYLRNSTPSVFASRTTRIASILEHRHPLADPSQPEHPTKNRPNKESPANVRLGQEFVEKLCLANVYDMIKMLRWNDRYNIKFMRLSSESFPFASHAEYGYKLAPFASEALAEVGKVVAELGHRVSMHPGQFTQLGSPREQVIKASIRDLEYHDEFLSLLKLPKQQDKDAILVLHMGGMFGDKEATLDRFRENYSKLPQGVKNRLVLENDDMCWNVHDLLPICKELNIPFVLDFHHHNIVFDETKIREGTKDIIELFPEIRETWTRKGITQKMHYSEPTPSAITPKQRRKHNPRVGTLPPCPNDMDLMIEAKDKEQAVLELMKTFKLPGFDSFSAIQPHIRPDENKPVRLAKPKSKGRNKDNDEEETVAPTIVPEEEVAMGGPEGRVYWPPGMEEWLRPVKRVVKKKTEPVVNGNAASTKKANGVAKTAPPASEDMTIDQVDKTSTGPQKSNGTRKSKPAATKKSSKPKREPSLTPSETGDPTINDDGPDDEELPPKKKTASSRKSVRSRSSRVSYKEEHDDDD